MLSDELLPLQSQSCIVFQYCTGLLIQLDIIMFYKVLIYLQLCVILKKHNKQVNIIHIENTTTSKRYSQHLQ